VIAHCRHSATAGQLTQTATTCLTAFASFREPVELGMLTARRVSVPGRPQKDLLDDVADRGKCRLAITENVGVPRVRWVVW
jgi:hypothetical protein